MVGRSDLPADLSDTAQLARLSDYLPEEAAVVSSDLLRATATADAISSGRPRLPNNTALREIHFGSWELKTFETVENLAHLRRFWDEPGDIRAPGGESWNDLRRRVDRAIDGLVFGHPDRPIIVVAHMGAILTQVQRALRISAFETFSHQIGNLSVTELHRQCGTWRSRRFNYHP